MDPSEAELFEDLVAERGYQLADSWRFRLAHCRTEALGPVSWWVRDDGSRAVGVRPACGIASWCPGCERVRAAKGARRLLAAVPGRQELWTLTVPKCGGQGLDATLRRRELLLGAWRRLRRVTGLRVWGWGAELVPPSHWHLHVVTQRGAADRAGRAFAPWEQTGWAGWRRLWAELVCSEWRGESWGSYPAWVRDGECARPFASAFVSEMDQRDGQASFYASKYASKPCAEVPVGERAQYAAALWRQRRVCVPRGARRPMGEWLAVPEGLAPAGEGRLDGEQAVALREEVRRRHCVVSAVMLSTGAHRLR